MEMLLQALAELVKAPLRSPFEPEIIVVQNKGTQRWLSMKLAYGPDEVWDMMPRTTQQQIIQKKLRFFRDRRHQGGERSRDGRPHQHRNANLFLRHQRSAAACGCHCRH